MKIIRRIFWYLVFLSLFFWSLVGSVYATDVQSANNKQINKENLIRFWKIFAIIKGDLWTDTWETTEQQFCEYLWKWTTKFKSIQSLWNVIYYILFWLIITWGFVTFIIYEFIFLWQFLLWNKTIDWKKNEWQTWQYTLSDALLTYLVKRWWRVMLAVLIYMVISSLVNLTNIVCN